MTDVAYQLLSKKKNSVTFNKPVSYTHLDVYKRQDQHSPILEQIPIFNAFLEGRDVSVEDHFLMDEPACNYGFTRLRQSADPIAADLARRLLDRDLFLSLIHI